MNKHRSLQKATRVFNAGIQKDGSGCWLWTKSKCQGYGNFQYGSISGAHRFSYLISRGCIHPNLLVCHTCDIPACVNPDHLFLGTDKTNAEDRISKNRSYRGGNRLPTKLNNDSASYILKYCKPRDKENSQSELARRFGVSRRAVQQVLCGRTWNHLATLAPKPNKNDSYGLTRA